MYVELSLLCLSSLGLGKLIWSLRSKKKRRNEALMPAQESEEVVAPRKEVLYDGFYYDVTDFISRHPGGNIIQFYVNNQEDATNAIQQFHLRSSSKVQLILQSFKKRPALPSNPSGEKTPDRYQLLTKDFQELHQQLVEEGFFEPSSLHVTYRLIEILSFSVAAFFMVQSSSMSFIVLAILFGGIAGGRYGWFMHEGGHYSLTGKPKVDRFLQELALGLGQGMSASWWRSQHNRHHAMPQRMKHDVDLNTGPFFAANVKLLKDPKKDTNFILRHQVYFFVPLGSLLLFLNWMLNLHPRYAWKKRNYLELAFILGHWIFIVSCVAAFWPMLFARVVGSGIMILNFSLSHSHLPITEEPRHWVEYSLSHTVNIQPSWWCDWWMGYLNYQIEHHLFPTMPQFRQRQIRHRVRALAEKHGLPYTVLSYTEAVTKTYRNFFEVSRELSQGLYHK